MPAPSYCTITGVVYKVAPTATSGSGTLAPSSRLVINPVSVTGNIISSARSVVVADPVTALVTIIAIQGSTINIEGNCKVYDVAGGVNLVIPSTSTATLESLTAVAAVAANGITAYDEATLLTGHYGTIKFLGAGIDAAEISSGVLGITVAGGAGLPVVDTQTIIKGSADATKLLRFEVDGFTTGTIRVATFPNKDGTVAMLDDIVAGSGTVTSFSAGDLSPLFTTSEATVTTTPALTFTLSTQLANLVFAGPTSGGAAAPAFRTLVAGDIPSLSSVYQPLDSTLTAVATYNTNGLLTQTAADTFTGRTITGTSNRLTVTNGDGVSGNPTLDISSSYVGQASITTLGTIAAGSIPNSLITGLGTMSTQAASAVAITGGTAAGLTGLAIRSTGAAFDLTFASSEVLGAGRTLSFVLGDAARTLTVGASASVAGSNTGDQTSVSGNAGTATALATARNINGVAFDGTANITVTAAAGTLSGATLASGVTASSLTSFGASIALGTPASGVLTNATGLPPTTGIVGWPANASGVLTNNGSGTLTWGAGGGGAAWGSITGTLADQTDLQSAIDLKANLASPTFTGTVALAALTASGTIVQTSASATAFESGLNGSTNPVFRLVNNIASQATGLSIKGNAAGAGVTLTTLSSGTNESMLLLPKGTGNISLQIATGGQVLLGAAGSKSIPPLAFLGALSTGLHLNGTTFLVFDSAGVVQFVVGPQTARLKSDSVLGFSSGDPEALGTDSAFTRISAGLIGVGTGAAGSAAGSLKLTSIKDVNAVQVLTTQQAAVADATDAPSVITQLNALLARLRTHGMIAA